MRATLTLFIFLLLGKAAFAQKEDHIWMLGLYNSTLPLEELSPMVLDFNENPFAISSVLEEFQFSFTNAIISNSEGELLLYSNGDEIRNKDHDIIINGDDFQPLWSGPGGDQGYPVPLGAIILPYPDSANHYLFISGELVSFYYSTVLTSGFSPLTYSVVEGGAGSLGEVIEKETTILTDTLRIGLLVATRHANGRDWWLVSNKFETNLFYRLLVSPEGVSVEGSQIVGDPISHGLPHATFSPNGDWYAQYNWSGVIPISTDVFIDLYQFDRCTGLLSNHLQIWDEGLAAPGGVCFSPNSRFLYVSQWDKILQFDLQASDIAASRDTVAVYDGFTAPNGPIMYATRFFHMQNAPDGKIYISCPNTPSKFLHVIDQPDSAGMACNVLQHHVELPKFNQFSLPNLPNYRLGALAGSPCDTILQILPPIAGFACTPDSVNAFLYSFADTSANSPDTWLWNFGDGSSSTDSNSVHSFPGNGVYEVCLNVSNAAGMDSICKTIVLQISGLSDIGAGEELHLFPNPAQLSFNLLLTGSLGQSTELRLYNVMGQLMKTFPIASRQGQYTFSTVGLDSGIYFCKLVQDETEMAVGKLVVRY